jgi:hypothetical protein
MIHRLGLIAAIACGLNLQACAGGPGGFTFGPRPVTPMTAAAIHRMDDTHEEGFKMPREEEEKEDLADKAGMTIVAVVVVVASVASAIAIPLLLANQ